MSNRRVALLVGKGGRVPAMLECVKDLEGVEIVLVLSCVGNDVGIRTAREHGVNVSIISWTYFRKLRNAKSTFERIVFLTLAAYQIDFVVMAGWQVLMGRPFIQKYKERVINIHPSLLPKYPGNGEKAIKDQWENRHEDKRAGCTLHRVDEGTDTGKVLLQYVLDPRECDSPEELAERIHKKEDYLLCEALELIAERKI